MYSWNYMCYSSCGIFFKTSSQDYQEVTLNNIFSKMSNYPSYKYGIFTGHVNFTCSLPVIHKLEYGTVILSFQNCRFHFHTGQIWPVSQFSLNYSIESIWRGLIKSVYKKKSKDIHCIWYIYIYIYDAYKCRSLPT